MSLSGSKFTCPGQGSPSLDYAAARNARLKSSLVWHFAGRPQHGWDIYLPLISHTIGTSKDAGTREFAAAICEWQRSRGLASDGVLDLESWNRMVADFQSARIANRSYPAPSQLVTAPASDFYDPTRPEELREVEAQTYAAYKRMISAAALDRAFDLRKDSKGQVADSERYLKIISAFRPREYQLQLRKQSPASGRAGLAINSPHFSGRALDLYVGGDPVDTRDSNRRAQTGLRIYQWLVVNAESFGFHPYFYEPWHWEYRPTLDRSSR